MSSTLEVYPQLARLPLWLRLCLPLLVLICYVCGEWDEAQPQSQILLCTYHFHMLIHTETATVCCCVPTVFPSARQIPGPVPRKGNELVRGLASVRGRQAFAELLGA
jgi:hypothetical protein